MVEKMYKKVQELSENTEDIDSVDKRSSILGKIKIFFGPSRQFANVFKTALLFSVEQHIRAK